MSRIFVLGEEVHVRGFSLAGAAVRPASSPDEVTAAWEEIEDDTALLIMTRSAADVLSGRLKERPWMVWTVMPR
jgi:vacuolar-type H+-ATPase subunit F/Vma7